MVHDDFTTGPTAASLPTEEQERLAKILDDYLVAAEHGAPVAPEELLRQHPADAEYLRCYLSGLQIFHEAVRGSRNGEATSTFADQGVQPGRTIADFSLLREIGRGGMGVVYEALQTSLRRRVALKVLPFSSAHDAKQISRFRNEAQAAAQVRHPNIVPVYAVGEEHGVHYYAMQLVEGQSLASLLGRLRGNSDSSPTGDTTVPNHTRTERGDMLATPSHALVRPQPHPLAATMDAAETPSHIQTVARLGIEAAEALHAAHEYGVIHRDVKPSNLLLDEHGKLWVTDFGLARCRESANLTQTGDILGTMRYMSPEQALGRNALVDHRTDVYSLGVTLYEFAALRHPADDVGDLQLFFDRTRSSYRPLRHWNRHIPRDFETIVMKAIAEFPHERYATAQEMADDLARFNDGKPILASRPNLAMRTGKWAKRHRGAVYASAGVAILAVIGLVVGLILFAQKNAETELALLQKTNSESQSRASLARAIAVLDGIGTRLAEQLASIPGAEGVRLQLLKDCVDYNQQIIDQTASDPTLDANNPQLKSSLALANGKIGDLTARLGDKQKALSYQQAARSIWEQLVADRAAEPTNSDYELRLARCENNIGVLLVELSLPTEALDSLQRAEQRQLRLLAADPQSTELAIDLATTDNSLGLALIQTGAKDEAAKKFLESIGRLERLQELLPKSEEVLRTLAAGYSNLASLEEAMDNEDAARVYGKAVAIQQQLAKSNPRNRSYAEKLAQTYNNLGFLSSRRQDWKTAEECYLSAIAIQGALAKAAPLDASFRRDLAISYNNLGMAQSGEARFAEAEASFGKALDHQQSLLVAQPQDAQTLSNLGGVYNNLGMLLDRQSHWVDAEPQYRKAIRYQQQAFSAAPDSDSVRELLSKHYFNFARNLREQRRPTAAADISLERKQLWPGQSERLYSVAQELTAACAAMAKLSHHEPDEQRYWQAAIDTVRDAVAAGLPADRLRDESLKALSDREEFRKMLVEAGATASHTGDARQADANQLN